MYQWRGFTLIELVLVMLLLGILGAVAVPRLMVSGQFEQRLQADKLVGLLRQAQLRAMNDPLSVTENAAISRCAKVVFTKQGFSIAAACNTQLLGSNIIKQQAEQGHFVGAENLNISVTSGVSDNVSLPFVLQFGDVADDDEYLSESSSLGRPLVNNVRLTEPLTITMGGKEVHIESEGYIHGP